MENTPQGGGAKRRSPRNPIRWLFNPEPEQPGEVPRRELACYTLGLTGQNQLYNMVKDKFFHFCTNVLLLDPTVVAMSIS